MREPSNLFGELKKDIEKIEKANQNNHSPENDNGETDSGIIEYYVPHVIYSSTKDSNPEDVKKTIKSLKAGIVNKREAGHKRDIRDVIFSLLALMAAGCFGFLAVSLFLDIRSERNMKAIREVVKAAKIQQEVLSVPVKDKDPEMESVQDSNIETMEISSSAGSLQAPLLEVYGELKERNENFYGWLSVEGTEIDYPIMQGPDNDFYLSHDIDKKYDKYGMLIMDYNCNDSLPVPQLIIYGHNVNSGKLFGELLNYKSSGYYDYHPLITLDSVTESHEYEIFAVFTTTVDETQKEQELFTTWGYSDDASYGEMVTWAKEKSMYECGEAPDFGRAILTLVTCEHSQDEGRLVVMAARK